MEMRILWSLLHDLEQLRKRDQWTREQLQSFQEQALSRMRKYAYARSPFYQQFHAGLLDRPLQELPVLTKSMLMEHFDELVTDRAIHLEAVRQYLAGAREAERFLGRYWVNATSGSSGRPGI